MATPLTVSQLISSYLVPRLNFLNAVEAFDHRGRNISPTTVSFPYQNWLTTPYAPIYYINNNNGIGQFVVPDSVDLVNGLATINSLQPGDSVFSSYTFQYLNQTTMMNFYYLAMDKLNSTNPASAFSLDNSLQGTSANYPIEFEEYLTNWAYKLCLETVLMDLMTWKGTLIWKDPQSLANFLQGIIAGIDATVMATMKTIKGRRFLLPHSTSIGNFNVPSQVSEQSWQAYASVGGSH